MICYYLIIRVISMLCFNTTFNIQAPEPSFSQTWKIPMEKEKNQNFINSISFWKLGNKEYSMSWIIIFFYRHIHTNSSSFKMSTVIEFLMVAVILSFNVAHTSYSFFHRKLFICHCVTLTADWRWNKKFGKTIMQMSVFESLYFKLR